MRVEDTRRIVRSSGVLVILSMLGMILGYTKEMLIAFYFGASLPVDSFVAAQIIPNIFQGIVNVVFFTVFLLIIGELFYKKKSIESTLNFIFLVFLGVLILSLGILYFLAPFLLNIMVSGLNNESFTLTVKLLRLLLLSIFFTSLCSILSALLHLRKHFIIPALYNICINIGYFILIFVFHDEVGIYSVVMGITAGSAVMFLIQLIAYIKIASHFAWKLNVDWSIIRKLAVLSFPLLLASIFYTLDRSIMFMLGSHLHIGALAQLNYGFLIISVPYVLIASSLATVVFPYFTELSAKKKKRELGELLTKSMQAATIILLPITILIFFFSTFIIQLLFERGQFTHQDTLVCALLIKAFAASIIFQGHIFLTSKAMYASNLPWWRTTLGALQVMLTAFCSYIFWNVFGVYGLALAFSVSSIVIFAITLLVFDKKIESFDLSRNLIFFARVAGIAIVLCGALYGIEKYFYDFIPSLTLKGVVQTASLGVSFLLAYYLLLKVLVKKELDSMLNAAISSLPANFIKL